MSAKHSETTERILLKLGIQTEYELSWVIEYCFANGNAGEAAGR